MQQFLVSSDSTCDLYRDYLDENDVKMVPHTFTVEKNGVIEERVDDFCSVEEYISFYREIREGAIVRTSMLNYEKHYEHFLKLAREGARKVLHFTISSGLSPTKDVAAKAAADVKEQYPDFEVAVVDPLTATVGQGALVMLGVRCRNEGKSLAEAYDYVLSRRLHIQHFIVVHDLRYLKKGGRIGATSALVGSLLNIKPILSFDREGKLFVLDKVKGVRKAITFIKRKMEIEGPDALGYVFIVHTDNFPAAAELETYVKEKFGIQPFVSVMGPVIGAHLGADAFALGYISESERNEF